jgi:sensor histidine kinase YesM
MNKLYVKRGLFYLATMLLFNTAIAGVITLLMPTISFTENLIFSHCIGGSISLISGVLIILAPRGILRVLAIAISMPLSTALGTSLAFWVTGHGSWSSPGAWQTVVIGCFFGFIGSVTYFLIEKINIEVEQKKLLQSESDRRQAEAHLKLLQAQIEPHFLFNTLANVSSLIDGNPELAKALLERLDDWLRVALARTRSQSTTLGDEIDMLENYLEIMKIRFGDRLRWHIEASVEASASAFPPMLLQPLVENAVRHGIEPKVGGGEIGIFAQIENGTLHIKVSDNGMGLGADAESTGVGLSNVRARLETLYGDAGKLTLHGNNEGGVTATLVLPNKKGAP